MSRHAIDSAIDRLFNEAVTFARRANEGVLTPEEAKHMEDVQRRCGAAIELLRDPRASTEIVLGVLNGEITPIQAKSRLYS